MLSFLGSNLSNTRQSLAQILNFGLVLSTAFMLWKGLSVFTASSSPIGTSSARDRYRSHF